nr:L-rhamnose mutarotase [Pararhizobium sp. IMCC21322]
MQRMGMVTGSKSEKVADYKRLHANVWPSVLDCLATSHIRNYSIFLRKPENLRWLTITDPCLVPLSTRKDGEFRAMMYDVFHLA